MAFLEGADQVHHGDVGGRHADGEAVQLAFQFRENQGDGLGGAGGGRDHGNGGGPGAAQILVRQVEDVLIVGVGVNRGHETLLDAEGVVEHLGYRRQAVGGAGGVGDDVVLASRRRGCR